MPPIAYPTFDRIEVDQPLFSWEWTVWPKERQSDFEATAGWLLELEPLRPHRVDVHSDGTRIYFEPHYLLSTWDEFVVDGSGRVKVVAYRGAFPFTLGSGPTLRRGIRETLAAIATRIRAKDPATAGKIDRTVAALDQFPDRGATPPREIEVRSQKELDDILADLVKAGRIRPPLP